MCLHPLFLLTNNKSTHLIYIAYGIYIPTNNIYSFVFSKLHLLNLSTLLMTNNYKSCDKIIPVDERFLRNLICPEKTLMEDRVMNNDGCRFCEFFSFQHLPRVPASFQKTFLVTGMGLVPHDGGYLPYDLSY